MEGTSQPTSPAGMSRLPIELFRKVTGYLAFFDKKAVQITSKKCHLLTGPFICPDILLWRLHCCRSGISCHRNSSLMSDIVELNSLTLKCLSRDTWIDVFQGREVRDAHLAFLDQWNSVNLRELPDGSHQRLMSLLSPGPTPMRWQQTLSQETRFALLHKM